MDSHGRSSLMRGMICGMATTLQDTNAPTIGPHRGGLFASGMRLVWAYVRLHPKPFMVSLAGALVFAVSSLLLTDALAKATNNVLCPALDPATCPGHPPAASTVWLSVLALMLFGCGRALGIMVRRYYSGVAGERVMATLRRDVSDRYRELATAVPP